MATSSLPRLKIWLAYVSSPITTAAYFERALRQIADVITIGPSIDRNHIEEWDLTNMKVPVSEHNIVTPYEPDMIEVLRQIPKEHHPDLFIWMESSYGFFPKNIEALRCPKACYMIDSHLRLSWHLPWAKQFDYVFVCHLQYRSAFIKNNARRAYWVPVGCDPEIHGKKTSEKIHPISFVGTLPARELVKNPGDFGYERLQYFSKIEEKYPIHVQRCFWTEMATVYSQSKIVFNKSVKGDLNMRVFEALASGSLLITDPCPGSAQPELFYPGQDLATYENADDLLAKIAYYLDHEEERETIARQGRERALRAHTYLHRCEAMLKVLTGQEASMPEPEDWRALSEGKDPFTFTIAPPRLKRSFVIPVLEMASTSECNLLALLEDLREIDGEAIVIFNSEAMAEKLKGHPRIQQSAVMRANVGVPRAWNLGSDLAETPFLYFMSSDLRVGRKAVDILQRSLERIDDAAVVGPQGSFFDFYNLTDYFYAEKGAFKRPTAVDAVTGAFFAVRAEHFQSGLLRFENAYTTCGFKTWDLGLQCRLTGWNSYVVPTTDYDHRCNDADRVGKFFDRSESPEAARAQNARQFQQKWLRIAAQVEQHPKAHAQWRSKPDAAAFHFLRSRWPEHLLRLAQEVEATGDLEKASKLREDAKYFLQPIPVARR